VLGLRHGPGAERRCAAQDELLPPSVRGVVTVSRAMLHEHRQLAAALVKARSTRYVALTCGAAIAVYRTEQALAVPYVCRCAAVPSHCSSDAVLAEPPDVGLHRSANSRLIADVLLSELRLLAGSAAADHDGLLAALTEHMGEDYASAATSALHHDLDGRPGGGRATQVTF
jgi:hypothetical protein